MTALNMQEPVGSGSSQDQTAWAIFILWIIFNHFGVAEGFANVWNRDTANNALVEGVFRKLEFTRLDFLPYLLN